MHKNANKDRHKKKWIAIVFLTLPILMKLRIVNHLKTSVMLAAITNLELKKSLKDLIVIFLNVEGIEPIMVGEPLNDKLFFNFYLKHFIFLKNYLI